MLAVVQIILTTWSKEFRGGPGATERNRVAEAEELMLPPKLPAEPACVTHAVKHVFGSIPGGTRLPGPPVQVHPANEPFHAGSIRVRWSDEQLQVDYHWTLDAGMPERYTRSGVLSLEPGEWGRVRYNARISGYHTPGGRDCSDWWYEKWVFNIGLLPTVDRRVFLETEPVEIHSQMDLLR